MIVAALPDGWSVEPWNAAHDDRYITIVAPAIGGVTVDFVVRGFRLGWVVTGSCAGKRGFAAYNGRGWRDRLVADAIRCLQGLNIKRKGAQA